MVKMIKVNKITIEGIASAFDLTGSYYRRSRKRTMRKIRMQTNFQKHENPFREATKLLRLAFDEKKRTDAKKH